VGCIHEQLRLFDALMRAFSSVFSCRIAVRPKQILREFGPGKGVPEQLRVYQSALELAYDLVWILLKFGFFSRASERAALSMAL